MTRSFSEEPANALSTRHGRSIGGAKGCLAWPNGDQPYLGDYKTDKTNVIYTWNVSAPSNAKSLGFTFVPQFWGPAFASSFSSTVVAGYAKYLLGFNEPNEPGQSNLDAETAAALWKQYIEPLKAKGYRLGSPATSSDPNGLSWM
ncbi:hypothetical protein BT96DRAFT_994259 [Gymnopus androsaceus JB14]|uniref:Asl1-like glycosyl hydrolase catalytic domain-containing protein n=1 Tax=Gymnopus androsaceus JB14 TaxID=1447944 RepID=A0A6A4HJX6_9AGAR|nr:hypothetical protein BT96DRAFT_994259 [Gymnopus androsaceus JB14]